MATIDVPLPKSQWCFCCRHGGTKPECYSVKDGRVWCQEKWGQYAPDMPTSDAKDALNPSPVHAMNALADAVKALNPTRTDLAIMATNTGIMVFYDKTRGMPAVPSCSVYTRDKS